MNEQTPSQSTDMGLRVLALISVLLLGVIATLLVLQTFDRPPETWSYTVLAPKDEELLTDLNQAGALGWEVVSARRAVTGDGSSTASYELILKRRGTTYIERQIGAPIRSK
jgi:hypothetical protein